jgi:hypothetical protein
MNVKTHFYKAKLMEKDYLGDRNIDGNKIQRSSGKTVSSLTGTPVTIVSR